MLRSFIQKLAVALSVDYLKTCAILCEVQQANVGHTRSVWFTSLSIEGIFTASFRISWKVGPTIASYIHVAPCMTHLFLSIEHNMFAVSLKLCPPALLSIGTYKCTTGIGLL